MARNDHSGYPMKWFKDENAARHAYECAICLEVVKDAVQVRDCGHQFCALCIDDILKADPRCPSCRIEISDAMVFADHAARRLIKKLEVNCCNEGCTWTGCLSSLLQGHQNNCNFLIHRVDDNAHKLKLDELEQKHDTLMLKVILFEEKHEQDITVLKLKHEEDIEGLKLKYEEDIKELKLKHQKDIKELELKHIQEKQDIRELQLKHQQEKEDIRELKLKLQQAENLWKQLNEKEKGFSDEKKIEKTSLKTSKNPWQRPEEREKDLSDEDKETAELYRNVVAILNKMTPEKCKTLVEQTMEMNIDTPERLEGVIHLIYETAICQPVFSAVYANMCRSLFTIKVADAEGEDVTFRKLLLSRCQREFEKEREDEQALLRKNQNQGKEKQVERNKIDEVFAKNKKRMLGNMKFIGELFKLKLLTKNIMHDCIFKLLRAGDEESLESMCKLLFTIGKDLDSEKAKPRMEQYFDQIEKVIAWRKISPRVLFILREVIELRENNWIPRHEEQSNPKTSETYITEVQEQRFPGQFSDKKARQVQRGNSRSSDIDTNTCLGGINVPFGIGPKLGQWGRSSSTGLNKSSQELDEPLHYRVHPSAGADRPHDFTRTASTPSFGGLLESDRRRIKSDADTYTRSGFEELRAFSANFRICKDEDGIKEKIEDDTEKDGAGQATPVTQVRKYDREFLLQLRYKPVCLEKPAGLPDMEIVLDGPVMPHKGAGSGRELPLPLFKKKRSLNNDVFCIVQDETSFSKFHVNLARSTSILDLYKRTAEEFGYEQNSFLLVLKHTEVGQVEEIELDDWSKFYTLNDVCQPPTKKKHCFFLRMKYLSYVPL